MSGPSGPNATVHETGTNVGIVLLKSNSLMVHRVRQLAVVGAASSSNELMTTNEALIIEQ